METAATASMDARQAAAEIKNQARRLGFDLVGIAAAEPSKYRDYLRAWLDSQQQGNMHYLERRFEERTDPRAYMPDAASVVCVAANYHVPLEAVGDQARCDRGRVARYALGDDYHVWMTQRLRALADWMRVAYPGVQTRACVDTAPVMEKELSARAGVGWLGKNTCVINESIGSWVVLGEVITTLALAADDAAIDRCGTCRRCIDACPTGAITAPYQLDARRCISYLTIEHPQPLDEAEKKMAVDWLFGCDICQEVCPWNGRAPMATDAAVQPRFATGTVELAEVMGWNAEDYARRLKGSAMKRVKLPVLQRNARGMRQELRNTL